MRDGGRREVLEEERLRGGAARGGGVSARASATHCDAAAGDAANPPIPFAEDSRHSPSASANERTKPLVTAAARAHRAARRASPEGDASNAAARVDFVVSGAVAVLSRRDSRSSSAGEARGFFSFAPPSAREDDSLAAAAAAPASASATVVSRCACANASGFRRATATATRVSRGFAASACSGTSLAYVFC